MSQRPVKSDRREDRGSGVSAFVSGNWRGWLFGLVVIAALVTAIAHWGEIAAFARLLREAQPIWLCLAIILQLSTYVSVAISWREILREAGAPRRLTLLVRIAITKLFADQALPGAGLGGNVLLVAQLRAAGISRGAAVAVPLLSTIGFYAAYALFAILMLILLWLHDRATPLMAGTVTLFLCVAIAIPVLALWLRKRGSAPLPRRLEQIGPVRSLLESVGQAPAGLLNDRGLLVRVAACNAFVFFADAATLFASLRALGGAAAFPTCFIALIMASIVATLGPIPLGLGTFEATSVATLRLLGVPFEAAFASTMLLRLLTLWIPLIPGMVLMRSAMRRLPASSSERRGALPRGGNR
ncbi:flippase-like domain-containing protein [Sphingomonas sp. MMSM20]|uniref:lysylphosphatidylglycerol synthase transmembrane domain-containing protein n=1 Tax=Sphingomonas lycopersici TaxID=2951807 RepID=UPI002237B462|nr:lysylphosphatidylglycerol synthase transmembrane domain-containing protein [Sphingomonas lycopersici]MCW6530183.1 flippase-like domain-containing protein [Sphingomonas lycopersici]